MPAAIFKGERVNIDVRSANGAFVLRSDSGTILAIVGDHALVADDDTTATISCAFDDLDAADRRAEQSR